jgi:hypothetical protein
MTRLNAFSTKAKVGRSFIVGYAASIESGGRSDSMIENEFSKCQDFGAESAEHTRQPRQISISLRTDLKSGLQ